MRWLLVLLLLGLASPLAAQDTATPDVLVRSRAEPASGAVIGQHVAFYVDVMFPGEMPRPPRVAIPEVAGLQAFRFETQATTLREQIDGVLHVGQRFEFALYARRGGDFTIPPAHVTLLDHDGEAAGSARGTPVALSVAVPPGIDASQPVVATRHLTLQEQWAPATGGEFKPGDAIVRTITRTAEDVPGLVLRDVPAAAPEGVRAYAEAPDSRDQINRGMVTSHRTDRITYVFERGGRFELPAVTQPWWDLGEGTLKLAEGAGATIAVAADAPPTASDDAPAKRMTLGLVFAGICLLLWAGARWAARRRAARATPAAAERRVFADLRKACEAGDARAAYHALGAWRGLLSPSARQETGLIAAPLEAALFGHGPWSARDGVALLDEVQRFRHRAVPPPVRSALPPLNPHRQMRDAGGPLLKP